MRLTNEEKEICKQYSKRDENNTVHCYECPLVINTTWTLCKANCRAEEWREHLDNYCPHCGAKMDEEAAQ